VSRLRGGLAVGRLHLALLTPALLLLGRRFRIERWGPHITPTMSFNGPDSLIASSPSTCRTSSTNARIVL